MTRFSAETADVSAVAEFIGAPHTQVAAAIARVSAGDAMLLVVSGWMGSGKDTVAPATLARLGFPDADHLYYAKPLKEELDAIIADIRRWFFTGRFGSMTQRRRDELAALLADRHHMSHAHASLFVGRLLDQARMNLSVHARSRTPIIREALQKLGTDVRRSQDADYWVKQALRPAVAALAEGRSVYFTDARFPNEVSNATPLGAFTVRLDISRPTQLARLTARDNITAVDRATLYHESETALDDYADFDVRVDNERDLDFCLDQIQDAWGAPVPLTA